MSTPAKRINIHLRGRALELYEAQAEGQRAEMVNRAIIALLDPDSLKRTKAMLVQVLEMAELMQVMETMEAENVEV